MIRRSGRRVGRLPPTRLAHGIAAQVMVLLTGQHHFRFGLNKLSGSENIDYQIDTTENFNSDLLREYTHTSAYSGQTVNDLRYGQKYFWRVRGWHDSDESDWSVAWTFTTEYELTDGPTLVSPDDGAVDISYQSLVLSWNSMDNVDMYQYQLSEDVDFTEIVKSGKTSLTFTSVENLTPSKVYYWRVRGENVNGYSPWSLVWGFTTETVELDPPVLFSPENNSIITESNVTLTWSEVFGATGYRVQVSASESFDTGVADYLTAETNKPVSGLSIGMTYYWRVYAYDNATESAWSEVWQFTAEEASLDVPTLITPQNESGDLNPEEISFSWSEVADATAYTIEISESVDFSTTYYYSTQGATSEVIAGFACETAYFWRVKASNQTLESEWSEVWSFVTANCTGIGDNEAAIITVYPNPAKDRVFINNSQSIPDASVEVYSVSGKLQMVKPFISSIDVSMLQSGMYILFVKDGNRAIGRAKFIKE